MSSAHGAISPIYWWRELWHRALTNPLRRLLGRLFCCLHILLLGLGSRNHFVEKCYRVEVLAFSASWHAVFRQQRSQLCLFVFAGHAGSDFSREESFWPIDNLEPHGAVVFDRYVVVDNHVLEDFRVVVPQRLDLDG